MPAKGRDRDDRRAASQFLDFAWPNNGGDQRRTWHATRRTTEVRFRQIRQSCGDDDDEDDDR